MARRVLHNLIYEASDQGFRETSMLTEHSDIIAHETVLVPLRREDRWRGGA